MKHFNFWPSCLCRCRLACAMAITPEVLAALIAVVGTLAGAVGGTMLSGWQATNTAKTVALLERERYAHDRLWDARREIYTDLIAKMRTFERAAGAVSDGFNDGELDPEAYFHSVGYDADNKNSVAAYRVLAEAYDDGRLMISETFAIRFELFLAGIYATDDEDPPARATIAFDAAATAHADLLAIALAEIAPKI